MRPVRRYRACPGGEPISSLPLTFFVAGEPKPQGSSRAFVVKGKAVITSTSKSMNSWRQRIATEAQRAMEENGYGILSGPIHIGAHFRMPRPKCIKNKTVPMDKKPDIDKLLRALNDALTGIAFTDDSQITSVLVTKEYAKPGDQPGVSVTIDADEVSS